VCTILFLGLWHDTHYLWILGLSDRDLHARYNGTFPGHIAQARVQGLTGPIALWGPFAPDVTSDTQAVEDDDDEDASDGDLQDEADYGRLGEKSPPDDDQDVGNDEDASGRQEGEGDEDGDQDDEDDAVGASETADAESA
jgi:hypothetical protein